MSFQMSEIDLILFQRDLERFTWVQTYSSSLCCFPYAPFLLPEGFVRNMSVFYNLDNQNLKFTNSTKKITNFQKYRVTMVILSKFDFNGLATVRKFRSHVTMLLLLKFTHLLVVLVPCIHTNSKGSITYFYDLT